MFEFLLPLAAFWVPGGEEFSLLSENHVLLLRPDQLQPVASVAGRPLVALAAGGEGEVLNILLSSRGYGQQLGEVVFLPRRVLCDRNSEQVIDTCRLYQSHDKHYRALPHTDRT